MKKLYLTLFWLCIYVISSAQITTSPALPTVSNPVTITFDATQGSAGLKGYTGDVYAHTGVITDKSTSSTDWKYVKTNWGTNTPDTKLTRIATNIYQLTIQPDIRTYYGVPTTEKILKMAFVFRSSDASLTGKATGDADIFVDLYSEGFNMAFKSPSKVTIASINQNVPVEVATSQTSDIRLFLNNQSLSQINGTSLTYSLQIPQSGSYWLKAYATLNQQILKDSVFISVPDNNLSGTIPSGVKDGINYIDNTTATLVLYAPNKTNAFVLGDFNNWLPTSDFQMKKDGNRFWLTLNNLTSGKEYVYQYLVDGTIKIGDPYCEKIVDPFDDQSISSTIYPNPTPYPTGKTTDRASVLQTNKPAYTWQYTNYTLPLKQNLVIYELLVRDFTTDKSFNGAITKLDYLKNLGINAIEIMPFNEFEGNSSWGYNPNYYFAVDKAYGTANNLKALIDECHKRNIIVIQDIVLNHAFNSCPLVQLYWDSANNRPAADNPWFNAVSPNPVYYWGSDFNHQSQATKDFVDRVTSFWMTEFKIDGFRFDFTKGFTNTPGDGSAYDASRIAILERISNKIWEVNPNAFVILEHFTDVSEERELVNYKNGMMVWGNANYNFCQAAMGYNIINNQQTSNFEWASYQKRQFAQPGLVAYMESHDEERQMFKSITWGNSSGDYNIKNISTAIDRSALCTTFFMNLTGPKMIWQFGELGYDYSIDYNSRVGEKPVQWDYFDDPVRKKLFNTYKAMISLRNDNPIFVSGTENLNVSGAMKRIGLSNSDMNTVLVGNFDVVSSTIDISFQHTGTWYEFFSGKSKNVTSTSELVTLAPGEYLLYTDKKTKTFTQITQPDNNDSTYVSTVISPNPTKDILSIHSSKTIEKIALFDQMGKLVKNFINRKVINIADLTAGMYFIRISFQDGTIENEKIMKI
ncbi:MAG: alpha-amylase family glycosyl hydrolase [Bacteroidota bacterium]|nr:alpha-amylase family glycosyl hydrolase [Bacteroidota bacterium]